MKLLTPQQHKQLLKNGCAQCAAEAEGKALDLRPVVKLFTPDAAATWLLTELHPNDNDIAFGLCDLGHGFPELGYVSLLELEQLRGPQGLPVARDLHFIADRPLSAYAAEARFHRRIVTAVMPEEPKPELPLIVIVTDDFPELPPEELEDADRSGDDDLDEDVLF